MGVFDCQGLTRLSLRNKEMGAMRNKQKPCWEEAVPIGQLLTHLGKSHSSPVCFITGLPMRNWETSCENRSNTSPS